MSAVERLRAALGPAVLTDEGTLDDHRADAWPRTTIDELAGRPRPRPLAVVTPATVDEAALAVRLCREERIPIVPAGGRSGVVGGVIARPDGIVLSTEALVGVDVSHEDLLVDAGAGTNGWTLEQGLQSEGLTTGHWPQSIRLSTVGGWVATRASGQSSTANGSIEDLVVALEAVLPDGRILRTRRTPRAAAGPDLRHLLLGSEGTLGLVTGVTLSVRPLPERRLTQVLRFPSFRSGLAAVRRVLAAGHRPAVVRLYDGVETVRHFARLLPGDEPALLLVHEGPRGSVEAETTLVADICRASGGSTGDAAAAEQWLEHRSDPPSARPYLERGVAVDTIEVAAPWSVVADLYEDLVTHLGELPGVAAVSAHASHAYRSGTNLYLTFAAVPPDGDLAAAYDACWAAAMRTTVAHGGGISHHHGIGRVRRRWLPDELGPAGVDLLRTVKRALDPDDLWNPGVLLPG